MKNLFIFSIVIICLSIVSCKLISGKKVNQAVTICCCLPNRTSVFISPQQCNIQGGYSCGGSSFQVKTLSINCPKLVPAQWDEYPKTRYVTINNPNTGLTKISITNSAGLVQWVGAIDSIPDPLSHTAVVNVAHLQSDPYCNEWSQSGMINITGSNLELPPSQLYNVQVEDCQEELNPSDSISTMTSVWCDIIPNGKFDQDDALGLLKCINSDPASPPFAACDIYPQNEVNKIANQEDFDICTISSPTP